MSPSTGSKDGSKSGPTTPAMFEYSKAANPIGSGHAPQVPIVRFGPEIYLDQPTGVVPLDLSKELGVKDR